MRDRAAACPLTWHDRATAGSNPSSASAVPSTPWPRAPRPAPPAALRRVRAPRRAGLRPPAWSRCRGSAALAASAAARRPPGRSAAAASAPDGAWRSRRARVGGRLRRRGPCARRTPGRSAGSAGSPRTPPTSIVEALERRWRSRSTSSRRPRTAARRGHDPPKALAHELGARWGVPVRAVLARERRSRQRGLTLAERRANVARSVLRRGSPPAVVLVDDVYTSGATVNAAASALRRGGRAARRGRHVRAGSSRVYSDPPGLIPAREEDALRLQVKGRNLEVTDSIRSYAEQKLAKLDKQLDDATLDRARARSREEPVDRGEPGRRGDRLDEGPDAARARSLRRTCARRSTS